MAQIAQPIVPRVVRTMSDYDAILKTEDFHDWTSTDDLIVKILMQLTVPDADSEISYPKLLKILLYETWVDKHYLHSIMPKLLRHPPIDPDGFVRGLRLVRRQS